MGIIIKESFKQTSIRIAISVVSGLSSIFIYTMDWELYGFLSYILGTAALFMPFVALGLGSASIRFFPYTAQNYEGRKSFLISLLKILLANAVFFSLIFYFFKDALLSLSRNPDKDYALYFNYVYFGAMLFGVVYFLVQYLANYKKVAIPDGLQSMYRLAQPVAFLLIFYGLISRGFGIWMVYAMLIIALFCLVYMIKNVLQNSQESDTIDPVDAMDWKSFWVYSFWAIAGSIGSMIAFRIDMFMVPTLTDFTQGGHYNMAAFMVGLIVIPTSSVVAIAHPIISQAWKDNDHEEIKMVYKKGSKNLLTIGAVMLVGLLLLLDFLPLVLERWAQPNQLKLIALVLGTGKLFDMASSVNGVIISHSKWYRYNTFFILILVVSNILLNYILILEMGILGAAIATAISLVLFNGLKTVLIYIKMDSLPFDGKTLIFSLGLCLLFGFIFWLPLHLAPYWALMINALVAATYFYFVVFIANFAPESKKTFLTVINKIIKI